MKKIATIHATYDPNSGEVRIRVEGDNFSLCSLIGAMIKHIGNEWGAKIGNMDLGFMKTVTYVLQAATSDIEEGVKIDLSAMHKED